MPLGWILLVVGIFLLIFEAVNPGFFIAIPGGVLVTLGIITIVFPGLLLTYWTPVIVVAIVLPLMFASMKFYKSISPTRKPTTTMTTSLVGEKGKVLKEVKPDEISGKVRVNGQLWSATADETIEEGEMVQVTDAKGVHIEVKNLRKKKD